MLNDAARGLIDKYAWVDEIEAWAVGVAEGRSADDVLRIYGGAPDDAVGDYTFTEMADLQGPGEPEPLRFHLHVFEVAGRVVTIENNGWSSSHPEIARRCSADGARFMSVYWNVNAFGQVVQAVGGRIEARFESLYPISDEPAQPGDRRPAWAVGEPVDVAVAWATCFALLEQQSGLAFQRDWLSRRRPTFRIPDPHSLYRDVEGGDQA